MRITPCAAQHEVVMLKRTAAANALERRCTCTSVLTALKHSAALLTSLPHAPVLTVVYPVSTRVVRDLQRI